MYKILSEEYISKELYCSKWQTRNIALSIAKQKTCSEFQGYGSWPKASYLEKKLISHTLTSGEETSQMTVWCPCLLMRLMRHYLYIQGNWSTTWAKQCQGLCGWLSYRFLTYPSEQTGTCQLLNPGILGGLESATVAEFNKRVSELSPGGERNMNVMYLYNPHWTFPFCPLPTKSRLSNQWQN